MDQNQDSRESKESKQEEYKPNMRGWALTPKDLPEAYKMISWLSWGFIFFGCLQLLLSYFIFEFTENWVDALIMLELGALLGLFKKRWLVVLILLYSVANLYYAITSGVGNAFLAAAFIFMSIQCINALSFIKKAKDAEAQDSYTPPKTTPFKWIAILTPFVIVSYAYVIYFTPIAMDRYLGYLDSLTDEEIALTLNQEFSAIEPSAFAPVSGMTITSLELTDDLEFIAHATINLDEFSITEEELEERVQNLVENYCQSPALVYLDERGAVYKLTVTYVVNDQEQKTITKEFELSECDKL